VLGTGGYRALVTGIDGVGVAIEVGFAGSGDEGQDLIGVFVDLVSDLATGRNGHHHDLGVFSGPQHLPEVRIIPGHVLDGEMLDVVAKGEVLFAHGRSPLFRVLILVFASLF